MVFDPLLLESKADSVDICIYINNKTVQYKYKDSVCVCVCVCVVVYTTNICKWCMSIVYECVCVCCSVRVEPVLGQRGITGEVFPLPPHGRVRCKTRAPVACCGNAGRSQLFSASASHEAGCTSHFPDAFAGTS